MAHNDMRAPLLVPPPYQHADGKDVDVATDHILVVPNENDPLKAHEEEEEELACCFPACAAASLSWRLFHALSFVLGGTTFIAGTLCLFYPGYDTLSALLYTIGSFGFLAVDCQELCTFKGGELLLNIFMSCVGSFLYVVGSVGFFPQLALPEMGIWGFILGSAVIGTSQLWKTHRIGSVPGKGFSLQRVFSDREAGTAIGVELGAGLGAWCFFFGTCMYKQGPLEGPDSVLLMVLQIWVAGSVLFTCGSLFLAWRHFVMQVV